MTVNTIVTPSSQVDSILPGYITETYTEFVNFMTKSDESEERVGFSQNLLQDLNRYRDFNTYKNKIVQEGVLAKNISATDTELELEDGYGFPEENGVLYIDDEIILYRLKTGNVFSELQRGASGTVILPTFTSKGTYQDTTAAAHNSQSIVDNISVLFLVSMLETIYESYVPGIIPSRVSPEINNATLLENIREFFQSKGSKLGIESLFKILFAENDVDVTYPGDRMITPSKSTWIEAEILRVLPIPVNLCPSSAKILPPDKFINCKLTYYKEGHEEDDSILATAVCEYVFSYVFEDDIQYELTLQKDSLSGNVLPSGNTILTRDVTATEETITVETTISFPSSGVVYIGTEGVSYTSKSLNQFFGCKRGYIGIQSPHYASDKIFGSRIIRGEITLDEVKYETYCWVLGLAEKVNVIDGGLLHKTSDSVYVNGPGAIDPRQPILVSLIENYDEKTVTQAALPPAMTNVSHFTAGINSAYFNDEFALVGTSGFPYYTIGQFSTDDSIGPNLIASPIVYGIPLEREIKPADQMDKGTNQIGVFVDGVAAYSDASPRKVIQGDIANFKVSLEGSGYVNPTVVIEPARSEAKATVVNGRITEVVASTSVLPGDYYTENPITRISSGEGATFEITFDIYGRIASVRVTTGGDYYNDVPVLSVVDSSNRGKGALLTATVSGGKVTAVVIVDSGIDYNPNTTSIVPFPIGSGAEVSATVQFYQFNRYQEVINNSTWTFDSGNGFLYENPAEDEERSTYGYVCSPTQLRNTLGDDGNQHSPILGWALDGNPIYGPYGYKNSKNDDIGITPMTTGYTLQSDRSNILPGGEVHNIGTVPPTVGTYDPTNGVYPMGTFTEDFVWQEEEIESFGFELLTDAGLNLLTENGLDFETNNTIANVNYLDRNNGRVCNTPEFPEELYPLGIYAYFVTIEENGAPAFPYILGTNYQNNAVEWYLDWSAGTNPPEKVRFGSTPYTPTRNFNTDKIQRYRTPYLTNVKEDIEVNISTVEKGGISSIVIEEALPANSMVGDLLYYDNTEQSGNGAVGLVTMIEGENITSSGGQILSTNLISHRQRLDLSMNTTLSFTFVPDTVIKTWNDAEAVVESYDPVTKQLIVQTFTLRLVSANTNKDQDGVLVPTFYDNLYKPVRLPGPNPENVLLGTAPLGSVTPNDVIVSYYRPTVGIGGDNVKPGDLWWSIYDGRLFIYYEDNDSSQWVVTQPLGTTPYGNLGIPSYSLASDSALVTAQENPSTVVLAPGGANTITISTTAPSQRADGSPNRMGDLWWSQETGTLFLWYTDGLQNYTTSGVYAENNSQWVITDPAGIAPIGHLDDSYASDQIYPEEQIAGVSASIYTNEISAMIADAAPANQPDGSPLELGNLFWSRKTGKLYVYWNDGDSEQWTVCNPSGSITGEYAMDKFPGGEVGPGPDIISPVGQIDELAKQKLLWFVDLDFFIPGDYVEFQTGAPGVPELTEQSICSILGPDDRNNSEFIRGFEGNAIDLPNGTLAINKTKALYVVNTDVPHNLSSGDLVYMSGSDFPEVNGLHVVVSAGRVVAAQVSVAINEEGQVAKLNLISPGKFYRNDFIISFTGGGGQSAFGRAIVSSQADGGYVKSVELLSGGYNYSEVPTPILGNEISNQVFYLYTSEVHGQDNDNVTYITRGQKAINKPARVVVSSAGVDYTEIPPAVGLYKKEGDRAITTVSLSGTSVDSVDVLGGGARYVDPTVIFYDLQGSGTGATGIATVENKIVTKIEVTSGGSGYKQPALVLVEESGKYISLTQEIGKITSMNVVDPGKKVSTDSSIKPELQILTRVIVSGPTGTFVEGSTVYQGTETNKQVTATVVSYDPKIQQITLEKVNGIIRANENIYDELGVYGLVRIPGEADCRIVVNGTSEPDGKFINQTSMIGTEYARVQDSYYYQWFSYSISSPLPKVQYETLVNDIAHPAGFIMFSELDVNKSVDISFEAEDVYISPVQVS